VEGITVVESLESLDPTDPTPLPLRFAPVLVAGGEGGRYARVVSR
jgi:hypothetical protein